jgi:hypothetical protein
MNLESVFGLELIVTPELDPSLCDRYLAARKACDDMLALRIGFGDYLEKLESLGVDIDDYATGLEENIHDFNQA